MDIDIKSLNYKKVKYYLFMKRLLDIVVSLFAIILLSWLFVVVAILVKISSKGPVIFKDQRIGKNGKNITILKYRTMYYDAEENIEKYLSEEQLKSWTIERKIIDDPRLTHLGKFLRKTSLDEIPQFIDCLLGKISLVGNRPITKVEYDRWYKEEEKVLLFQLKPGMTGLWQVEGRSDITFDSGERQRLDLLYYHQRSFLLDLKILVLTIKAVLLKEGAR